MASSSPLESRIAAALQTCIGRPLRSVHYVCLQAEAVQADIVQPEFYFGGELALTFDHVPLFISWDQCGAWPCHFSVCASPQTMFPDADRLERFDGSASPLWARHMGQALESCRIVGADGTPYGVVLCFADGGTLVGTGWETEFGDGDDVITRDVAYLRDVPNLETFWTARASTC